MAFGFKCDIGMPTLLEITDITECARIADEYGLNFIEINMNMPEFQPYLLDKNLLNDLREKYGLYFTFHLDENFNVTDFNDYVSHAYIKTVKDTIALAKNIQSPVINFHMPGGVYFTLEGDKKYLFEIYKDRFLQGFKNFVDMCADLTADSIMRICIENTNGFKNYQKEAMKYALKFNCFALTYDAGHEFSTGHKDGIWYSEMKDKVSHIHLHDAVKIRNHLALGEGKVDILRIMRFAENRHSSVVLETKTLNVLNKSINYLKLF